MSTCWTMETVAGGIDGHQLRVAKGLALALPNYFAYRVMEDHCIIWEDNQRGYGSCGWGVVDGHSVLIGFPTYDMVLLVLLCRCCAYKAFEFNIDFQSLTERGICWVDLRLWNRMALVGLGWAWSDIKEGIDGWLGMNCVKGFFSVSVGCLLQREKLAVVGVICYDIRYVLDLDILVFICFLWPEPYESGTKTHIYGGMGSLVGLFLIILCMRKLLYKAAKQGSLLLHFLPPPYSH
ncbi:hypothetical protein Lal_00027464 [Lupinus albus]|nr:hypothetical protein Lal_00027464 [Lupinus albus]